VIGGARQNETPWLVRFAARVAVVALYCSSSLMPVAVESAVVAAGGEVLPVRIDRQGVQVISR
jgi:hypothetical protein